MVSAREDPWRVVMSTDHPNGGAFLAYPQIIRLLMDRTFRQDVLKTVHPAVLERTILKDLDREYSLSEICVITRAGPARDPRPAPQGTLGSRCRRGRDDLHAAREQTDHVRGAAIRHQRRTDPRRGLRIARTARRQDAARRTDLRSGDRNGHRRLVREVLLGRVSQLSRVRRVPAPIRSGRLWSRPRVPGRLATASHR